MTKKCILLVIDSLGVGAAPDADEYGDINANTFGNVSKEVGPLNLPTFNKLGFGKMTNIFLSRSTFFRINLNESDSSSSCKNSVQSLFRCKLVKFIFLFQR